MNTTLKLKHGSTLMRFYDWVKQWSDRLPLSIEDKNSQAIGKKSEQKTS